MKPETVLKAIRLVKDGKVYELGRVLESGMPTFGTRRFGLHTARSSGPTGVNQIRGNEELVVTELGQVGTQFDALPHIGIGDMLYNCVKTDEVATRNGFTKLGVETVGGLITRGVLLDIAGLKGVEMLEAGYEITVADLEEAMKRHGVTIGTGDAVLIHTGWGKLWMKDNAKYNSGQPGIGIPAGEWLVKLNPILVGADNWGIEVRPHPNKDLSLPRAPDPDHHLWDLSLGESRSRRSGPGEGLGVRLCCPAAQDQGWHGLDGGSCGAEIVDHHKDRTSSGVLPATTDWYPGREALCPCQSLRRTKRYSRLPPASAPTSLPLSAAAHTWRSAQVPLEWKGGLPRLKQQ